MRAVSRTRKIYLAQLGLRAAVLIGCIFLLILKPEQLDILQGWNFFRRFSPFHLLWLVWMLDMLWQLVPVKKHLTIALGSQKHFRFRYLPIRDTFNYQALRRHIVSTTKAAYKVFAIWFAVAALIAVLWFFGVLTDNALFMITVVFYVCDLICVLVWCPFRLILKTRCCTTCRIFNWDHLMMFIPMLPVRGFFSVSLLLMAFAVWLIWELCIMMYPERFWEHSNAALKCENCTDKLCTQYCGKKRTS